jgi:hypothetical protein
MREPKADFKINGYQEDIFIECGSILLEKETNNIQQNILNKIEKKSQKQYATQNTVLFINLSNPTYTSISGRDKTLNQDEVKPILEKAIESSSFGSIVSFHPFFILNNNTSCIKYFNIVRYDSKNINTSLKDFLDINIEDNNFSEPFHAYVPKH